MNLIEACSRIVAFLARTLFEFIEFTISVPNRDKFNTMLQSWAKHEPMCTHYVDPEELLPRQELAIQKGRMWKKRPFGFILPDCQTELAELAKLLVRGDTAGRL
eukprot:6280122-Amphidinium_carterae.1